METVLDRDVSLEEANVLSSVCFCLQNSDSGAYTRYAKVKNSGGIYSHGGNDSFTGSFYFDENHRPKLKDFAYDFGMKK